MKKYFNFVSVVARRLVSVLRVQRHAHQAWAQDVIRSGWASGNSLSGTMAIKQLDTSLKDVALMTIEELNAKGGLLGKKIQPVVVDPASNWPLFAEKARELLTKRIRSPPCSAAGPRCRASPCCPCSRS